MSIPENLKYSAEHEWVKVLENNVALIGITDHAQSELGDIVYLEVDSLNENINQGEIFGTVEAVKTTSDLYMPISGTIIEINEKLSEDGDDNPALINEDPYGDGWIIKVEISDMEELGMLMSAGDYSELTK